MKSKIWLGLVFSFFSFTLSANTLDEISKTQANLVQEIEVITTASREDSLFSEDILRRKNSNLRESIAAEVSELTQDEKLEAIVVAQIALLEQLIHISDVKVKKLATEAREAKGIAKGELQFKAQQRVGIMDTYYSQLSETYNWADKLGIETDRNTFKDELESRGEFLYNLILYVDSNKASLEDRIEFATEEDKAELTKEHAQLVQQIRFLIASFEMTVPLMEENGLNVTEYQQLLFSMTGEINTDVLDAGVAFGLLTEWLEAFKDWAFENTPSLIVKLFVFCLVLWITRSLAKVVAKVVKKSVSHSKMDFSVLMQDFFVSIASKGVTFIGLLVALSQLGINLGPLLTGFGVAGVIIGFALQDTLSNFASGLMILIYRPFDVKDLVNVAGIQGNVSHMSLVSTTIRTLDNQTLVIPNNKIWGDVINNMTSERVRRVDMTFGIGYQDNFDYAFEVIHEILDAHPSVLKRPERNVRVHTLNESSVDIIVRPWVKTDDYWDVYWDITEEVKRQFDAKGITIPFPQRDVHLYKHES